MRPQALVRSSRKPRRVLAKAAEDEGSWIFSYADLITLLLMFFLVLLSLAQVSEERFAVVQQGVEKALTGEVKTQVPSRRAKPLAPRAETSSQPVDEKAASSEPKSPVIKRKAQGDPRAKFETILSRLDSRIVTALDAQRVAEVDAALVIIPVSRLFQTRRVTLSPEDEGLFKALVAGLVEATPEGRRLSIAVRTTPTAGRYPWGTTSARAGTLAEIARFVTPEHWQITAAGLGDGNRADGEAQSEAQQGNEPGRRIELRVHVPRMRKGGEE